jgi:hypothetical protein
MSLLSIASASVSNSRSSPSLFAARSRRWSPSRCVLCAAVRAQRPKVRGLVVVEVDDVYDFEALG